jgi:type IV pilus biogenesis protein CpaD/CtpE
MIMTFIRNVVWIMALVALSACEMSSPSRINMSPITVEEELKLTTVPVDQFDQDAAAAIAADYDRYGQGPVRVLVLYDPSQPALRAEQQAAEKGLLLEDAGIRTVEVNALPVSDSTKVGVVMIDYTRLTAKVPLGCTSHPGDGHEAIANNEDGYFDDYRFGCGVDQYLVGQVARPADFLGQDTMDKAAADRAAAGLDKYRSGEDFGDLKGTNASELTTK